MREHGHSNPMCSKAVPSARIALVFVSYTGNLDLSDSDAPQETAASVVFVFDGAGFADVVGAGASCKSPRPAARPDCHHFPPVLRNHYSFRFLACENAPCGSRCRKTLPAGLDQVHGGGSRRPGARSTGHDLGN